MSSRPESSWYKFGGTQLFCLVAVVILPVLDTLSGALFKLGYIGDGSVGSPSQIGRLVALAFVAALMARTSSANIKYLAIICSCYMVLVEVIVALIHWDFFAFVFGIVNSFKILFFIFSALLFTEGIRKGYITYHELELWLIRYGTVVGILVLAAYVSGFHISNYSKGIATRGLFISGNGLGVVLGCSALASIHRAGKLSLAAMPNILLLLIATALIGTKGGLAFFAIAMIYLMIKMVRSAPIITSFVAACFCYFFLLPVLGALSMIFENIIFKFHNIDNKWVLLASSRDQFIADAFDVVDWDGYRAARFLVGGGGYFAYEDFGDGPTALRKFLENDLFELFFMYGILAALSYILLYFRVVFLAIRSRRFFYLMLTSLTFFHSILAGHVLYNGTSALTFALVVALASAPRSERGVG